MLTYKDNNFFFSRAHRICTVESPCQEEVMKIVKSMAMEPLKLTIPKCLGDLLRSSQWVKPVAMVMKRWPIYRNRGLPSGKLT